MYAHKSTFWKSLVFGLLFNFGVACTPLSLDTGLTPEENRFNLGVITLLIVNEGITPVTVRDNLGHKLAWVFPNEEKCVILLRENFSQELKAQVGRGRLFLVSAAFLPNTSPTGGWVWFVNDILPVHTTNSLVSLEPPCRK